MHCRRSPNWRARRRLVAARRAVVLRRRRGCRVFLVRHGSVHHGHAHRHGLLHAECLEVHGKPHWSGHAHGAVLALCHDGGMRRCPHHVLHGYSGRHNVCWGPVGWRHCRHGHGRSCLLLLRWNLRGHRHRRGVGRQRVHREVSLRRHCLSLGWHRVLSRRGHGVSLRCHDVWLSLRWNGVSLWGHSLWHGLALRRWHHLT